MQRTPEGSSETSPLHNATSPYSHPVGLELVAISKMKSSFTLLLNPKPQRCKNCIPTLKGMPTTSLQARSRYNASAFWQGSRRAGGGRGGKGEGQEE